MQKTVSLPFMLLGILFNVCLVASNLLETKVIQLGPITATAGYFRFLILSTTVSLRFGDSKKPGSLSGVVSP